MFWITFAETEPLLRHSIGCWHFLPCSLFLCYYYCRIYNVDILNIWKLLAKFHTYVDTIFPISVFISVCQWACLTCQLFLILSRWWVANVTSCQAKDISSFHFTSRIIVVMFTKGKIVFLQGSTIEIKVHLHLYHGKHLSNLQ